MARFAPARADGLKPWVVSRHEWGRTTEYIVYAKSSSDAAYRVKGRYVTARARRATPEDVEAIRGYE